jgi:plastocyanin
LTAQGFAFDKSTLTVPAGASVTMNLTNGDAGVPHNFALYDGPALGKSFFVGRLVTGPAMATYTFTAPTVPGTYFFRCDVHPSMSGSFVVT